MASATLSGIAETLNRLATPGMTPKELLRSVRAAHPDATKKDVVRAAFYSVIAHAGEDAERAGRLHDFAISARSDLTEVPPEPTPRRKRKGKRTKD